MRAMRGHATSPPVAAALLLLSVLGAGLLCAEGRGQEAVPHGNALSGPALLVRQFPLVDSLLRPGERYFSSLRQITFGGENAEAYWSRDGRALVMQSTDAIHPCDQIFLYAAGKGVQPRMVSTGTGRTTCSYFLDRDRVLFSSTHLASPDCPPPPDRSRGYVWAVYPGYDIFVRDFTSGSLTRLTDSPGYDAEATVSPDGRTIVFTSLRDGDLDVYTMDTSGQNVRRLTTELGYDGGPFFSPDGKWICYRSYHPADTSEASDYRRLLARSLVRPTKMDLWIMRADGSEKRQVTRLPGASFAPFFTPDGRRLIFASNYETPHGRDFNLYLVKLDGSGLERVTNDPSFDGFPMFSPDGRYLAFSSNRGAVQQGETNVFVAKWSSEIGLPNLTSEPPR